MPFSSTQLEAAWAVILTSLSETEWVDLLISTTGEYYRFTVSNGKLYHWNRTTGVWDLTPSLPAGLVNVSMRVA